MPQMYVKNTRVKIMCCKDIDLYSAGTNVHLLRGTVYILHIPIKVDVWTCRFLKDNHIHFPISYSSILLDYDRHWWICEIMQVNVCLWIYSMRNIDYIYVGFLTYIFFIFLKFRLNFEIPIQTVKLNRILDKFNFSFYIHFMQTTSFKNLLLHG